MKNDAFGLRRMCFPCASLVHCSTNHVSPRFTPEIWGLCPISCVTWQASWVIRSNRSDVARWEVSPHLFPDILPDISLFLVVFSNEKLLPIGWECWFRDFKVVPPGQGAGWMTLPAGFEQMTLHPDEQTSPSASRGPVDGEGDIFSDPEDWPDPLDPRIPRTGTSEHRN